MQVRCPHCQCTIDVMADDTWSSILCTSCGSHFSLTGDDSTQTAGPDEVRKLAHFELIRELGMGKFGVVWLAQDTTLQRKVAVKIPRLRELSPHEAELFFRDARAAAQVRHPGIVHVNEVGRHDDTVYIVSDYIEGANLKDWKKSRRPTARESAEIVAQIAEALDEVHRAGVVHRDLKPANILMDAEGKPHITDFGLAKRESGEVTMTQDGQILGTPAYMSPEQAAGKGHKADRRTDVFSLGVILYELLTGRLPFDGQNQMLLMQIQNDEPRRPRLIDKTIPRDLETICLRCMEKAPDKRYRGADEVGEDLRRWLRGEGIKGKSASPINVARVFRRVFGTAIPRLVWMPLVLVTLWLAFIFGAEVKDYIQLGSFPFSVSARNVDRRAGSDARANQPLSVQGQSDSLNSRDHVPDGATAANARNPVVARLGQPAEQSKDEKLKLDSAEIFEKYSPSVAVVKGKVGSGSGFLLPDNILATNNHVARSELIEDVLVEFPDAKEQFQRGPFKVDLLYEDARRDIAFLQLRGECKLPALQVANPVEFRPGATVTFIGSPMSPAGVTKNDVSHGILRGKSTLDNVDWYSCQLDLRHGSAGGPVFDHSGRVIGMVTMRSGMNYDTTYCIPADEILAHFRQSNYQTTAEMMGANALKHRLRALAERLNSAAGVYSIYVEQFLQVMRNSEKDGFDEKQIADSRRSIEKMVMDQVGKMLPEYVERIANPVENDLNVPAGVKDSFAKLLESRNASKQAYSQVMGMKSLSEDERKQILKATRESNEQRQQVLQKLFEELEGIGM